MDEIKKIFTDFIEKVKENPGALFGILYPYFLVIIVIIGLYYVSNVGNVAINKSPAFVPDTTVVADLPVVPARTVPPVDIFKVKEPTSELIQNGKELYITNCASCHNETGAGGGPASVGLNPAPRNFTSPDGWKNGRTLSAIYTTLEEGIQGGAMISYNFLTPQDRIDLAHYIRSEFMKDPPKDSDDDLAALNQLYNLSAGMKVPAQIPVAAAMEIIVGESESKEKELDLSLKLLENYRTKYETKLLEYIVDSKKLAITALINSNDWKRSKNDFIDFITLNVNQNGFNRRVFNLSESDRNVLYNYLKQIL